MKRLSLVIAGLLLPCLPALAQTLVPGGGAALTGSVTLTSLTASGIVQSSYNAPGIYPDSRANGWAITSNFNSSLGSYNGLNSVVFWNPVNNAITNFQWQQKTGASASYTAMQLIGDVADVFTELDVTAPADGTTSATFLGSATGAGANGYVGSNTKDFIVLGGNHNNMAALANGAVLVGDSKVVTLNGALGELGIEKITDPATAPGAGTLKLTVEAGTNPGTCKIMARAGTSATAVLLLDNVGTGC